MLRPSPNHGTQRLPNDDDDDDVIPVIPVQRQCLVMSLVVGIQGQKAYGLCKTPLCAELVVQFSP